MVKIVATPVACLAIILPVVLADPSCNATNSCGPRPKFDKCSDVVGSFDRLMCVFNNATQHCNWKAIPCPVCSVAACGPRPGEPNFLCPDGITVAGPGPCSYIVSTAACGYPIISCPVCNATTCGPKPPSKTCPNGVVVGPGPCAFDKRTHKCAYGGTPKCPPPCNTTSCGPKVDKVCPDGTLVKAGPCGFNRTTSQCEYKYPKCAPICSSTSCGPPPKIPNRLCPDGITIAGPSACVLDDEKKHCQYQITNCPRCKTDSDCTGTDIFCSTDHFCRASVTCSSDKDCVNPNNHYAITTLLPLDCVGCTTCMKGVCGRSCTPCSRVCRPETNFTNCDACSRAKKCQNCQSSCV